MDAQELLEQKLSAYEHGLFDRYVGRLGGLPQDEEAANGFDYEPFVQSMDPAILKAEFEEALRWISADFSFSFNETLLAIGKRDRRAGPLLDRYRMRAEHELAIEGGLRQAMNPVYLALNELHSARGAYTSFKATSVSRTLSTGMQGMMLGKIVGGLIAGPIGIVAAGALGAYLGSGQDKQGHAILHDFLVRVDAVTNARAGAWEIIVRQVQDLYSSYFGEALQQLGRELKAKPPTRQLERGRQPTTEDPDPPRRSIGVALVVVMVLLLAVACTATWWLSTHTWVASGNAAGMSPAPPASKP